MQLSDTAPLSGAQAVHRPGPATVPAMLHLHATFQDILTVGDEHADTAQAASTAMGVDVAGLGQAWLKLEAVVHSSVLPELAAAGLLLPPNRAQACVGEARAVVHACF